MDYESYAVTSDCTQYGIATFDGIDKALRQASRHVDSLTFNRIVAVGFDNLTQFQQDIIVEVVCRQAQFEHENSDLIDSVLSSYSINGVSLSFGNSWNIEIQEGIAMHKELYALLRQTGLCCRQIGG